MPSRSNHHMGQYRQTAAKQLRRSGYQGCTNTPFGSRHYEGRRSMRNERGWIGEFGSTDLDGGRCNFETSLILGV